MAICKKCGAEVIDGAQFCTECGEALVQPFEAGSAAAATNLVFEDPIADYKKAEEQAAHSEGQNFTMHSSTENADNGSGTGQDWSNQSNYGKPQFDNTVPPMPNNDWEHSKYENTNGGVNYNSGDLRQSDAQGNDKIWAILSYFTLLLWIIAFFIGSNNGQRSNYLKTHFNQSFVLHIISIVAGWVLKGWAEWIVAVVVLVLAIMGIIYAVQGKDQEIPGVGQIKIIK